MTVLPFNDDSREYLERQSADWQEPTFMQDLFSPMCGSDLSVQRTLFPMGADDDGIDRLDAPRPTLPDLPGQQHFFE